MKIYGHYNSNIQKLNKAYLRQSDSAERKNRSSESAGLKKKDEIILSSQAAELRKFEELTKNFPEDQSEKAEVIKQQIELGEYFVEGKAVAKSILYFLRITV